MATMWLLTVCMPDERQRTEAANTLNQAGRVILASGGRVRVEDLAYRVGWSRRKLERQFARHVGLSPKALCRVARLQELVTRLGTQPLAHLALDLGFADQAHLSRDFRSLAGQTITDYAAENHALSDCFTSVS